MHNIKPMNTLPITSDSSVILSAITPHLSKEIYAILPNYHPIAKIAISGIALYSLSYAVNNVSISSIYGMIKNFISKKYTILIEHDNYVRNNAHNNTNSDDNKIYYGLLLYLSKNETVMYSILSQRSNFVLKIPINCSMKLKNGILLESNRIRRLDGLNGMIKELSFHLTHHNKKVLDEFISECSDIYDSHFSNNSNALYCVFSDSKSIELNHNKSFDRMYIDNKQWILKKIDDYQNNIHKTSKLNILLHGPPGTGKTTFILSLSKYLKRHIQYVKLSDFDSFDKLVSSIFKVNSPTKDLRNGMYLTETLPRIEIPPEKKIVVFEDIDVDNDVVKDMYDKDGEDKKKITLSDLMNIFDGVFENNKMIIIMTTNNRASINKTLIRPGRIQLDLLLDNINSENAAMMINDYYNEYSVPVIIKSRFMSPATLENMLFQCNDKGELVKMLNEKYGTEWRSV